MAPNTPEEAKAHVKSFYEKIAEHVKAFSHDAK
jgi:hypothetical protein